MRFILAIALLLLMNNSALIAQEYQLGKPIIQVSDNGLFFNNAKVQLDFRLEGVNLYYTLNGKEPNKKSKRYKKSLLIKKSSLLKVKAFKKGFQPSETVSVQLHKLTSFHSNNSIKVTPEAKPPYDGSAWGYTLLDLKAGSMNFRDGNWLGFNEGPIEIVILVGQFNKVRELIVSSLNSPSSWIFPPATIELASSEDGNEYKKIGIQTIKPLRKDQSSGKAHYSFSLKRKIGRYLKLTIQPLESLPDWHPGKGNAAWVFLDEIIIN